MYKGYRNFISKKTNNKNLLSLPQLAQCKKCSNLNLITVSPAKNNISNCTYCGNPYYIIPSN